MVEGLPLSAGTTIVARTLVDWLCRGGKKLRIKPAPFVQYTESLSPARPLWQRKTARAPQGGSISPHPIFMTYAPIECHLLASVTTQDVYIILESCEAGVALPQGNQGGGCLSLVPINWKLLVTSTRTGEVIATMDGQRGVCRRDRV